jgi:glycosyltransferase involved in cell wall biosynthesis
MAKLSVCIPTYNRKDFLRQALQSLQQQTFKDFETVILDDGSTDGTEQMVRDLDMDIKYNWQQNSGEVATTNRLMEMAQCEYISFLHSDDLLVNDALQRLQEARQAQSDDVVVYGNYLKIDESGHICGASTRKLYSGSITQHLFEDIIVHPVGSLFPRKALLQVGGLDGSLKACYDYKMELLLSLKYKFVALDKPTFMRRRHTSNSSQISLRNRLTEYEVLKDFYYNLGGKEVIPEKIARKRLAKEAYRAACSAIDENKLQQAKELLRESWAMSKNIKTLFCMRKCF